MNKWIRSSAVHAVNAALLAILLVGLPSVTGVKLGTIRLSSHFWLERLILAGLGLGIAANALLSWRARTSRTRRAAHTWILLHGTIMTVALLTYVRWIEFGWLKQFLTWLGTWRPG